MMHAKKSKIDQEKAKLWGIRKSFHFICTALYYNLHKIFLKIEQEIEEICFYQNDDDDLACFHPHHTNVFM